MDKPLVSIIVNCYNGEKYLDQCLKSIFSQTYKNWEVIFWDNNSNDNSCKIFNSYNDNRLKYYKSKVNVSLGQARAWAVEKCAGKFISFLHFYILHFTFFYFFLISLSYIKPAPALASPILALYIFVCASFQRHGA